MGETTGIAWADKTFSPWTGCTKVSPACDGCYAEHLMDHRFKRVEWGGPGVGAGTRTLMSKGYWEDPAKWNREAIDAGTRPFVFPSLCDPFDSEVDPEWRRRFFQLMRDTPALVWLLLTKRIGNVIKMCDADSLPSNVALGATFANQEEWDRDSPKLEIAAHAVDPMFTFASFEPMLGPIRFTDWAPDWIIGGGETDQGAHKARPTHPKWARRLRDQSADLGKLFCWKQNGEWIDVHYADGDSENYIFPDGETVRRVGKAKAGRLIDGVLYDARPHVPALPKPVASA